MEDKKFDPKKLERLNDPKRLTMLNPDLIWRALGLKDPRVLVDIGAGTGFFAVPFSRKTHHGKVYACDISDVMLDWMKEHLPPDTRDAVVPVKMDEDAVPLPDGIADLVYMINLHHELELPAAIMAEARRLLRKGGSLMIIDWKKEETPEGPPVSIRVAEETIMSDLRAAGFSGITLHKVLPYHNFVVGVKQNEARK